MVRDFPVKDLPFISPNEFWRTKPGFYRTAPGSFPDDPDSDSIVWLVLWPGFHPQQITVPCLDTEPEPEEPEEPEDQKDTEPEPDPVWCGFHAAICLRTLAYREEENGHYLRELVYAFIEEEEKTDALARVDAAEKRLRTAFHECALELRDRLVPLASHVRHMNSEESRAKLRAEKPDFFGEPSTLAGHWERNEDADEIYAAFLETLGKDERSEARKLARIVRKRSSERRDKTPLERWQPWLPHNGKAANRHTSLLRAVWLDVVRPKLERESKRHPAVATPVMNMLVATLVREPNVQDRDDGSRAIVDHHGHAVATLLLAEVNAVPGRTVDELLASVARGMKKLGGLPSHRTLLWLVKKAAEQDVALVQNSGTITIEGGYARLAELVGVSSSNRGTDEIRDIIEALSVMHVVTESEITNVLMRSFTRATGHRPSVLKITLGEPLVAGWVHRLPQRDQQLVPLVDLCPTAWARDNERGPLCTARLHVVSRMRERASELAETGAVTFGRADWTDIGALAQVPSKTLERAIEGEWLRDHDSDAPAFLSSPAAGRFCLAPAHQAAHLFLVEGGKLTLNRRAAGQRSAQKRRSELDRRSGRWSDK